MNETIEMFYDDRLLFPLQESNFDSMSFHS